MTRESLGDAGWEAMVAGSTDGTVERITPWCWHCNGNGFVPTGQHDSNGEEITRQCGVCDGWGKR